MTYTLRVTNTSNVLDTIIFSRESPGWPTSFSFTDLAVARGGRRNIQVYVTVPVTAAGGQSDQALIRATGSGGMAEVSLITRSAWRRIFLPLVLRDAS